MLCYFLPPDKVILLIRLSAIALVISCVSASPTMRKKYGARGHPCLTPLSTLKLPLGHPLRLTVAEALPKSNLTHLMNSSLTPILLMVRKKNLQETLSYAFEKSNLRKTVSCLEVFSQCKVSWVRTMLSRINLKDKKRFARG